MVIPELLDMVDTGQIKFNPAVELSYLASEEQYILFYFHLFEFLYFFNKFYKKYCILDRKRYNLY